MPSRACKKRKASSKRQRLSDKQRSMVEKHKPIVGWVLNRLWDDEWFRAGWRGDHEEAFAAGCQFLCWAALAWKPEGEATFPTYAVAVLKREYQRYSRQNGVIHVPENVV